MDWLGRNGYDRGLGVLPSTPTAVYDPSRGQDRLVSGIYEHRAPGWPRRSKRPRWALAAAEQITEFLLTCGSALDLSLDRT